MIMNTFSKPDFSGDGFVVDSARVNAHELLGYGHTIPDTYWRAEMLLPSEYEMKNLQLRKLWQKDRQVAWPEIDMQLHLQANTLPIGWRVVQHLYYEQELIPIEWLEYLVGGGLIIFPYATCYQRDATTHKDTVCCPAFFHDSGVIDARAVNRFTAPSMGLIAVYHKT